MTVETDEGPSLRESIGAAMDATEAETTPAAVEAPAPAEAPAPTEVAKPTAEEKAAARDAAGRFSKKAAAGVPVPAPAAAASAAPTPAPAAEAAPVVPAVPAPEALKAPQGWKATAREKWASVPPEAQAEVLRREREVATALNEVAPVRKFREEFERTVSPYMGMIQAEGGTPMAAIGNLLQTAAALRTAPAAHKASIVANLIKTFGVDISALDAELSGQAPAPTQAHTTQPQQFRDPRFDAFLQQQQQQLVQKTQATLQQFATSHEFFDDVRAEMADLMEVASRRGVAMDPEAAYNRACSLHPEISQVLEQRKAAEAANASQASTQRARAASSSVRSQPAGGSPSAKSDGSTRADLMAAMELHGL